MKLICKDVKIDWMESCGNSPDVDIIGAETIPLKPKRGVPAWTAVKGLHLAVNGDFVHFFYTDGKPSRGFGGAKLEGTFFDGTDFEYVGGWSSRADCVNQLFPLKVVDVCFRPHGLAGHVAADWLIDWRTRNPRPWGLAWRISSNGERILEPTRNGDDFKQILAKGERKTIVIESMR